MLIIPSTTTKVTESNSSKSSTKPIIRHKYKQADYDIHEPIQISSDLQFNDQALAEGWSGDGSKEDPFVIESLNISSTIDCIEITNVDSYFIVRNCWLSNPLIYDDDENPVISDFGIYIQYSGHGMIDSCYISNKHSGIRIVEANCSIYNNTSINQRYHGIYVYWTDNSTIINNTIKHCDNGIYIENSNNLTICDNNIAFISNHGISTRCRYSIIRDNRIETSVEGIHIHRAYDTSIINNQITNCSYSSISVNENGHLNISHNTFTGAGISLSMWGGFNYWSFDSIGNTVNGKPIYYTKDMHHLNIDPSTYGQVILFNCSECAIQGGTIADTNVGIQIGFCDLIVIRNVVVDNCSAVGISVTCSDSSEIEYCTITNSGAGIALRLTENCTIRENIITNCSESAIYLGTANNGLYIGNEISKVGSSITGFRISNTENSTFQDNILVNAGFRMNGYMLECWSHIMVNNIVNGKLLGYFNRISDAEIDVGQYAQVILGGCERVTIKNGRFENIPVGVDLGFCEGCVVQNMTINNCSLYGIGVKNTPSSLITNNTVNYCHYDGIYLDASFHTNVTSNIVTDNEACGIRLQSCQNVKVFGNSIGWNKWVNGYDSSDHNMWDDGIDIGNAWSDYNGTGYYSIEGFGEVFDHFPTKYLRPTVNQSTTITQTEQNPVTLFVILGAIGIGIEVIIIVAIIRSKNSIEN